MTWLVTFARPFTVDGRRYWVGDRTRLDVATAGLLAAGGFLLPPAGPTGADATSDPGTPAGG